MYADLSQINWNEESCRYEQFETPIYRALFFGFVSYKDFPDTKTSAQFVISDFIDHSIDFDLLIGSYRFIIEDKVTGQISFFCDNAGFLCFFYEDGRTGVSDSFLEFLPHTQKVAPDYQAITEFLNYNRIHSLRTLVRGVVRTDPECYYFIQEGKVTACSKNLSDFSELKRFSSLHEIIGKQLEAVADQNKIAIITGGTDSRTVLSHLEAFGEAPDLIISGADEQVDVVVARKISETLGRKLYIAHPKQDIDEKYIDDLFCFSDGLVGLININRLLQKVEMERQLKKTVEFGGVAGEFYKNSFLFHIRNKSAKTADLDVATTHLFRKRSDVPGLLGEKTAVHFDRLYEDILERIRPLQGETLAKTYLKIGQDWLRSIIITMSNSASRWILTASPLMERDSIALVFDKKPKELEMGRFQRNEVTKYCPELKDIKTDRVQNCNASALAVLGDKLRNFKYLFTLAMKKYIKKQPAFSSSVYDTIYAEILSSEQAKDALESCRALGIVRQDRTYESMKQEIAERVMTVGMVFRQFRDKLN